MRLLLSGVLALFLTACGISPVRDAAPATDLQMMKLGVDALTQPRQVAGTIKHPDQARTDRELMGVATDLDDVVWLDEGDKVRVRKFVADAVVLIEKALLPKCAMLDFRCRRSNAKALRDTSTALPLPR